MGGGAGTEKSAPVKAERAELSEHRRQELLKKMSIIEDHVRTSWGSTEEISKIKEELDKVEKGDIISNIDLLFSKVMEVESATLRILDPETLERIEERRSQEAWEAMRYFTELHNTYMLIKTSPSLLCAKKLGFPSYLIKDVAGALDALNLIDENKELDEKRYNELLKPIFDRIPKDELYGRRMRNTCGVIENWGEAGLRFLRENIHIFLEKDEQLVLWAEPTTEAVLGQINKMRREYANWTKHARIMEITFLAYNKLKFSGGDVPPGALYQAVYETCMREYAEKVERTLRKNGVDLKDLEKQNPNAFVSGARFLLPLEGKKEIDLYDPRPALTKLSEMLESAARQHEGFIYESDLTAISETFIPRMKSVEEKGMKVSNWFCSLLPSSTIEGSFILVQYDPESIGESTKDFHSFSRVSFTCKAVPVGDVLLVTDLDVEEKFFEERGTLYALPENSLDIVYRFALANGFRRIYILTPEEVEKVSGKIDNPKLMERCHGRAPENLGFKRKHLENPIKLKTESKEVEITEVYASTLFHYEFI